MHRLSDSIRGVQESETMAITSRAAALRRAGEDVIALAAGEPDFDTPAHIVVAAKEAMDAGFTHYTAASGIPELRAAWAEAIGRKRGVTYDASQLMVTSGAKQAVFNVVYALVGPGDEVIIPSPYWVSYSEQAKLAGGTPVIVETDSEEGFKLTATQLRGAITDRTRLLILNSPCNPTGSVYMPADLTALAGVLVDAHVPVLSDEVYEELVYGCEFTSIASLGKEISDLTFVVTGVSKTYAMTGWRIGCVAGNAEVIATAGRLQSQTTSGANSIAQKAALAAITGDQSSVEVMRREFDKRRQYVIQRLNAIPGIACAQPDGAFYAFPCMVAYYRRSYAGNPIEGSADLCRLLLEHGKVALVPGAAFGNDAYVRLSYAASAIQLEKALDRLERFLGGVS